MGGNSEWEVFCWKFRVARHQPLCANCDFCSATRPWLGAKPYELYSPHMVTRLASCSSSISAAISSRAEKTSAIRRTGSSTYAREVRLRLRQPQLGGFSFSL